MTLVYDLETGYARVAAFVIWALSAGTIRTRPLRHLLRDDR